MELSLFARLSPELRNTIYDFAFESTYAVTLQNNNIQAGVTRSCRQLRSESLEMYYSLARFNAHLDDGPATKLAHWMKTIGRKHCLLRELNVWDLHMLNATLHGAEATQRRLDQPPVAGKRYYLRPTSKDWLLGRGWYLKDIVIALYSIGLQLIMFRSCEPGSNPSNDNMTSHFSIAPIPTPSYRFSRFCFNDTLWDLLSHLGFSDDMCHEVLNQLSDLGRYRRGEKQEIRLRRGRRDFILVLVGWNLLSIRQTYIPREEDFVF